MIPVLFESIGLRFTSNGICRLSDIISCVVTEERNGIYECEFKYPVSGQHYERIKENMIICCTHDEVGDKQPFRIYRRSAPMNGIVTFNARHIAYDLMNVIVRPFTAGSCALTMAAFEEQVLSDSHFTFWTDKVVNATFTLDHPSSIWELLGGSEGSVLDVYGTGEWKFDGFDAKLYLHRGEDNGVTIRYGKNLLDINQTKDIESSYNAIIPFWKDEESGTVVYGDVIQASNATKEVFDWTTDKGAYITYDSDGSHTIQFTAVQPKPVVHDFSESFEEQPTVEQLNAKALAYLNNNAPWNPNENIKVNFVALWQMKEYEQYALLQRVKLCDTVTVIYPELGINAKSKVIKTVYNVLLERYDNIEIGDIKSSFGGAVASSVVNQTTEIIKETTNFLEDRIEKSTEMITGNSGGYIVQRLDADGHPYEILIMDTDDVDTAINVMRLNVNGIGFSSNGINGPYRTAWTLQDASFVADFITAGTMMANRISGGTLTLGGVNNGNGILQILDAQGNVITTGNNEGIETKSLTADEYVYVDGTSQSFFKIPLTQSLTVPSFLQLSKDGFLININDGKAVITDEVVHYADTQYNSVPNDAVGELRWTYSDSSEVWKTSIAPCSVYLAKGTESGNGSFTESYSTGMVPGIVSVMHGSTWMYLDVYRNQFYCSGNKSRLMETENYGHRLLYCYETPDPLFGDIGEGQIGEDGLCYVWLDKIFAETIEVSSYQVFLQPYGEGMAYILERNSVYFVVKGTAGLKFGWEMKAKQKDDDMKRLDRLEPNEITAEKSPDMGQLAFEHIMELRKEIIYD